MGITKVNGAPPPRPTRAGTVPLGEHSSSNGIAPSSSFRDPTPHDASLNAANHAGFLSQPTPPALHHQPFSAPINPYAGQNNVEEPKIGLTMGVPMNIVDSKDKDLPKDPVAAGRNRSGTGKSLNNKKSVFGVLTGEYIHICVTQG